jgi:hypothetical protein
MKRSIFDSFCDDEETDFDFWFIRMRLFLGGYVSSILTASPVKIVGITSESGGQFYQNLEHPSLPAFVSQGGLIIPLELAYFSPNGDETIASPILH